jgi:hypothetical protein
MMHDKTEVVYLYPKESLIKNRMIPELHGDLVGAN